MIDHCQAGHETHDTKKIETSLGEMTIFDWEKYMGFEGYCPGQDDVSKTLEATGVWDVPVEARIRAILHEGDRRNTFIDVGAHIGYFSKIAVQMGYTVKAHEGEKENLRLLKLNVPEAKAIYTWFDSKLVGKKWCTSCSLQKKIELIKMDIEGSEEYAVSYFESCIGVVKNIIMEVSPVFNGSYPKLVDHLVSLGFAVYELDGTPFNFDYSFDQKDLWFKRI